MSYNRINFFAPTLSLETTVNLGGFHVFFLWETAEKSLEIPQGSCSW